MAIYPDRDRHGKLTGHYRIEVQKGRTRLRGRADSMAKAKEVEDDLMGRLASGDVIQLPKGPIVRAASTVLTMREASKRAKGKLWSGQSTEAESLRKLERLVGLLGDDTSLDAVGPNQIDDLMGALKETGVSDATVNRYLSCLSAFLKWCRKREFRTVEVPELEWRDEDEGRIRWLTYAEEATLMELLDAPYSTIVFIAIRTGMRASELLNLKADQIEPRWVHLWGTGTKNGTSRSVPLTPEVYKPLKALVSAGMPGYWELRWAWEKARKAMNLSDDPTFVFHSCRHSYATRAVQAGVNIRVLQKLMGHKTINTTLRYAHVDDETLADAATKALAFHAQKAGGIDGGMRRNPASRGAREPQKRVVLRNGVPPHRDCKSVYAGSIPARASTLSAICHQSLPISDTWASAIGHHP